MARERPIIEIDGEKCDGCGACIPDCPEGALKIVNGKARLVGEALCDGLGACLGRCPRGAIRVISREAEDYDEEKVMANIARSGAGAIAGHLRHLAEHGQDKDLTRARAWLAREGITVPENSRAGADDPGQAPAPAGRGCPGAMERAGRKNPSGPKDGDGQQSELRQWPVQLRLTPPGAPFFKKADVLLAADCVAYALAGFHAAHLRGKALAIACPKLDGERDRYRERIREMVDDARINTLTVMTMEVPCCRGLLETAREALAAAKRKVPLKSLVVGIDGRIVSEEWI